MEVVGRAWSIELCQPKKEKVREEEGLEKGKNNGLLLKNILQILQQKVYERLEESEKTQIHSISDLEGIQ